MFLLSAEERVRSQNCWVARSLSKTPDTFNLWLFHFKQYWWQLFPPPFGTPFCCKLANCSPNDSFISIFILFVTEFFYITKTIITMISRKNCGYTKTALKNSNTFEYAELCYKRWLLRSLLYKTLLTFSPFLFVADTWINKCCYSTCKLLAF